MPNQTKLSQLTPRPASAPTDQVVLFSNNISADILVPVQSLFSNSSLTAANLIITQNTTPSNSSQNTQVGQIWSDGSYIYYSLANNSIVRTALSAF